MTPVALVEAEESPALTAVRLHEFLNQAAHQLQSGIDQLDLALSAL